MWIMLCVNPLSLCLYLMSALWLDWNLFIIFFTLFFSYQFFSLTTRKYSTNGHVLRLKFTCTLCVLLKNIHLFYLNLSFYFVTHMIEPYCFTHCMRKKVWNLFWHDISRGNTFQPRFLLLLLQSFHNAKDSKLLIAFSHY